MIKIGLKLTFQDHYDNTVAGGVLRYARNKLDWEINGEGHWFNNTTSDLDALIARIESEEEQKIYEKLDIPVVDIAGAIRSDKFSTVRNDDWDTGVRCGSYFYKIGAKNYAMCMVSNTTWARERMLGFCSGIGISCEKLNIFSRPLEWWHQLYSENNPELEDWLKKLPHSTALFCCNDLSAMKVSVSLRKLQISVPSDVLILGVDNEEILCMLAKPTISSMALQLDKLGFTAAKVLDEILETKDGKKVVYRIPPLQVIERESTTLILDEDPLVSSAVSIIKKNIGGIFTVTDLVEKLSCSRRSIEVKFRKSRNISIHEFIIEEKLNKATQLLVSTNYPIKVIFGECGFGSLQRFHSSFIKKYGITPQKYRKMKTLT